MLQVDLFPKNHWTSSSLKHAFFATLLSRKQIHPFRKLNQGMMSPVLLWEGSGINEHFIRKSCGGFVLLLIIFPTFMVGLSQLHP